MLRKYKKTIAFVCVIALIILAIWFFSSISPKDILPIIEPVATVLGLFLVLVELKESRDLSEGSFVSGLSDGFANNEGIQRLYKKIELNQEITDDDTIDIVAYLTYYETIFVLLKKGAIDISLIDDLFAYRFRIALNNSAIRRISLVRYDYAYVNIYKLESIWCKFKKEKSILKIHNPNYNIVMKGNKMNKNDIVLKIATKNQVDEIYSVMEEVYNRLEDKSLYVCDDLEYVKSHIENEGFAVIACNSTSKIVGSFIFRYPMQSEDNLGRDIGLEEEQLKKVVHMESSVVLPEYRGRGLQLSMLQYGEELIDQSKYKYLMATVSPDNKWSYNSFEKNGYKLMVTKEKYNGLMRRIYLKEI